MFLRTCIIMVNCANYCWKWSICNVTKLFEIGSTKVRKIYVIAIAGWTALLAAPAVDATVLISNLCNTFFWINILFWSLLCICLKKEKKKPICVENRSNFGLKWWLWWSQCCVIDITMLVLHILFFSLCVCVQERSGNVEFLFICGCNEHSFPSPFIWINLILVASCQHLCYHGEIAQEYVWISHTEHSSSGCLVLSVKGVYYMVF